MSRPEKVRLAVRNLSTVVPDADVKEALPAFQQQADFHLPRYWEHSTPVDLYFLEDDEGPRYKTEWLAEIFDNAEQARQCGVVHISLDTLGYHILTEPVRGYIVPFIIIFAEDAEDAGYSWTVTFSHELVESLVDPICTRNFPSSALSLEVCDPVWTQAYPVTDANVWVSNFVTPNWFRPGADGLYDFMGHVGAPLEVPLGGAVTTNWDGKSTTLVMTARGLVPVPQDPEIGPVLGGWRARPRTNRSPRDRYWSYSAWTH
jgi:hypothetical protein